jgi:hypothetical protein
MSKIPTRALTVISAGRTRDLVGWQPAHLAEVLAGKAPARHGPRSPAFFIDLEQVGAVVLWTKQPATLLDSPELGRLLPELRKRQILVLLQLSVTGLGGSPLEPGIPGPFETASTLERILERGLLHGPDCVKLRWDPVAEYDLGLSPIGSSRGRRLILGNASIDLFTPVFERFRSIGALRWTSSVLDLKYQGAAGRLKEVGIIVAEDDPERYRPFYSAMARTVTVAGGRFSICCSPPLEPWVSGDGCIDGDWINGIRAKHFGLSAPAVETVLHNVKRKGGQRQRCGCSYSVDISYSTGFRTCATQYEEGGWGGCCLYCYSWHGGSGAATGDKVRAALEALRARPPLDAAAMNSGTFWHRGLRAREAQDVLS